MKKANLLFIAVCLITLSSKAQTQDQWNKKKCAVVLTYDDAIDVDLDNVVPALDSLKLKGTFYLIGSSPAVDKRINEWRAIAKNGHELGNHTLYHPCDGSKPGRSFVTPANDLSKYTVDREVSEALINNTLLKAIDGKSIRTFAYPCGDTQINGVPFYPRLRNAFAAARGVVGGMQPIDKVNLDDVNCYSINGQDANYMIGLVKQAMESHTLLVFLFHGVGGGHSINVDKNEHSKLLHFLAQNQKDIWVAPMVEVAQYVKNNQTNRK